MKSDFRFIFFALAAKQIFAHSPVSPFQIDLLSIDKECKNRISHYIIDHFILILLDTECHFFYIRHFSIYRTSQLTSIEIGITITIRPPKFRMVNDQLRYVIFVNR